jgi:hypothetical protein
MRFFAFAAALAAIVATVPAVTPADAGPSLTRYCAMYKGGAENCGFYSFNQCMSALWGNGGICTVATYQGDLIRVHTPRGSYLIRN